MYHARLSAAFAALALAVAAGCGGNEADPVDASPDAYIGPAAALFEVPRGAPPPSGFYALPYPNDIRVDEETGAIDLADYIRPNPLIGLYVDSISNAQRGFSINAGIFFCFDAPIDASSLPATPSDALADDASVYLVDVDPDSPRKGERVPLRFRFEPRSGETIGDNWLSVLPYPGFVLDELTTYALVLTDRLRATDGTAVAAAPDFAAIAGNAVPDDAALARAQTLYQPLWDWLDEAGGDERGDVISAAVYTTQDATSLLGKVRQVIWDTVPAPVLRDLVIRGRRDNYFWYDGRYDGPNFQRGEAPYDRMDDGGDIVLDEQGLPIVQRMEDLRVSFTVPIGKMPAAGWPVAIYAHGTGGSFHSYRNDHTAERLAKQGLAVISIDQVLHPPRVPEGTSPEVAFFNFQNPLSARHNALQGAIDDFQLLRLVLGIKISELDEESNATRVTTFDPERIYFFGHSQGGLTGPPFLAHEPMVKGAVLSGAGGLLYFSLLYKTEPVDIAGLAQALIRDYPLDEFNPVLALLQGWIDVSDATAFAPLLVRRPLDGIGAKDIYQSEGFTDRYTPTVSIEALATAIGGQQVNPVIQDIPGLALRGSAIGDAPVSGNLDGKTAVLMQYEQRSDSDGHYVVFDVPSAEEQSARFLGSLAATGAATLEP
jgi:dienelactone hydrolase